MSLGGQFLMSPDIWIVLGQLDQIQVRSGDKIESGTQVGTLGNTGLSITPSLTVVAKYGTEYLDPEDVFWRFLN